MICDDCIDYLRLSHSLYEPTTAFLKDKPLCDKGIKYVGGYICQNIKANYHRPKRKNGN